MALVQWLRGCVRYHPAHRCNVFNIFHHRPLIRAVRHRSRVEWAKRKKISVSEEQRTTSRHN